MRTSRRPGTPRAPPPDNSVRFVVEDILAAARRHELREGFTYAAGTGAISSRYSPQGRPYVPPSPVSLDEISLEFILWNPIERHEGLVLVGEMPTFVNDRRRCSANLAYESDAGQQQW
jgi:hypothetical protein